VYREEQIPAFRGHLDDRGEIEYGGIVDKDVDRAGPRDHRRDHRVDRRLDRDVERNRERLVAEIPGETLNLIDRAIGDRYGGALGDIALDDGRTNAPRAARHDSNLALEPRHRRALPSWSKRWIWAGSG